MDDFPKVTDLLAYKSRKQLKTLEEQAERAFIAATNSTPRHFLEHVFPTYKIHVEPTAVSLEYSLFGNFDNSSSMHLGRLRLKNPTLGMKGGGVRIQNRPYLVQDCPHNIYWRLCEHLEDAFERLGTELMLTGFQQIEQLPFRTVRINDELRLVGLSQNERSDTMYFVGRGLVTPCEYKRICDSFSDS